MFSGQLLLVLYLSHLRMQAAAVLAWTTLCVFDSNEIYILQPAGDVFAMELANYRVQRNIC